MALDEAFDSIVLTPLREIMPADIVTAGFDKAALTLLGQGQTPCTNHDLALLYSYAYLYMHLDAYKEVIRLQ